MRTLAALLFIAAAAALAIGLAQTPTVVDGRVMAADRLEEVRKDGVVGMDCDAQIPIGLHGAAFTCLATLADGATQIVEYTLRADGQLAWKPRPPTRASAPRAPERKPASDDPWAQRP
jgi:hypothetical protein